MPVNSAAFMPCRELIYSYRLFSIGKIILEPLFVKVKVYYIIQCPYFKGIPIVSIVY